MAPVPDHRKRPPHPPASGRHSQTAAISTGTFFPHSLAAGVLFLLLSATAGCTWGEQRPNLEKENERLQTRLEMVHQNCRILFEESRRRAEALTAGDRLLREVSRRLSKYADIGPVSPPPSADQPAGTGTPRSPGARPGAEHLRQTLSAIERQLDRQQTTVHNLKSELQALRAERAHLKRKSGRLQTKLRHKEVALLNLQHRLADTEPAGDQPTGQPAAPAVPVDHFQMAGR